MFRAAILKLGAGRHLAGTSLAALCIAVAPAPAQAQEASRNFDVPSQPLGRALLELGRQARISIAAPRSAVAGRTSAALSGAMPVREAMTRILEGSGLGFEFVSGNAVRVFDPGEGEAGGAAAEIGSAELVVTGTRIRGRHNEASPSVTLDRDYIVQTGATTVEDVMRTLPQNSTFGTNEFAAAVSSTRNGSLANLAGGTGINLRGLGNTSTLVLIDGRRLAPGGIGEFIDISTFPVSAIERIEVVPDGASAIYGSDAVGGVVNFLLREDFRGAETSLRYGLTTEGSLRRFGASQLFGFGDDRDSLMVVLDYADHDPLLGSERPFTSAFGIGRRSYLSLDSERAGITAVFSKALTPNLRLTGMGIANRRDVDSLTYHPTQLRLVSFNGRTREAAGTLGLEWDVSPSWRLNFATTYSYSRTHRTNYWEPTATVAALDNEVISRQSLWSTTVDGEGPLFRLPGGAARLAIGVEHRREGQNVTRIRTGSSSPPRNRDINAAYAEILLPLVGSDNEGAFGRRFELTGAFRFEDYSDFGSTENVKLGGVWEPVAGLSLRGTFGTSFRAPLLYNFETSLGAAFTFNVPTPTGAIPTLFITNYPADDLGPETATTWTAGLDVSPPGWRGFNLNLTYYDIDYRDRITASPTSLTLFQDPLLLPLISRPPDPELVALVPFLTFTPLTPIPLSQMQASFDGRTRNQARTRMRGLDLVVSKAFTFRSGTLTASMNASYILDLVYQQVAGVPGISVVDTIFNPNDLKLRAQLAWSDGNLSISGAVNHIDSYTDNQLATAIVQVPSMTTIDLSASYRFTSGLLNGLTLRAAVTNLLNEYPPFIIDRRSSFGNPGYDTQNHSPLGRILSFEIIQRW